MAGGFWSASARMAANRRSLSLAALSAFRTEITEFSENTEDRATPSAGALRDLRASVSSVNQSEFSANTGDARKRRNPPKHLEEACYGSFRATAFHVARSAFFTEFTEKDENTEDRATPSADAVRDLWVSVISVNYSGIPAGTDAARMHRIPSKPLQETGYGGFLATAFHVALSALSTEFNEKNENTEDRATPSAGALCDL